MDGEQHRTTNGSISSQQQKKRHFSAVYQCCNHCISPHLLAVSRLTASDIMEPNLTYVYPHTRIQSLVSILRTTVYHAFPVVTENRHNEREFMKGNILVSNNIRFKVRSCFDHQGEVELCAEIQGM